MKQGIHPTYNKEAKVKCACGATYAIGSTDDEISVEICAACHPFYTGKQKLLDAAGRVDKFRARVAAAKPSAPKAERKSSAKAEEKTEEKTADK